jgi:hypothetical protein
MAAYRRGWINQTASSEKHKMTRHQARMDLLDDHTHTLQKQFIDLPLVCPPITELRHLLQRSLQFERNIMWSQLQSHEQGVVAGDNSDNYNDNKDK